VFRVTRVPSHGAVVIAMLHAVSPAAGRAAAAVPVTLLSVFIGLLWLLGLACGKDRRQYVTNISEQAMRAISAIWHDASVAQLSAHHAGSARSVEAHAVEPVSGIDAHKQPDVADQGN
jgi:hypothetical protein